MLRHPRHHSWICHCTDRWHSGYPCWNDLVLHSRLKEWILAGGNGSTRQGENGLHYWPWALAIQGDALWLVQCSSHLRAFDGTSSGQPPTVNSSSLSGWHPPSWSNIQPPGKMLRISIYGSLASGLVNHILQFGGMALFSKTARHKLKSVRHESRYRFYMEVA